ncbi:MAG: M23 family metallopeptidase [Paracoccaceae bacterium]
MMEWLQVARWGGLCLLLANCAQNLYGQAVGYSPVAPEPIDVVMPAGARYISQQFSPRQENVVYAHTGLDVWGDTKTPIIAAAPGVVIAAKVEPMHGRQIHVLHGTDKDGQMVFTTYHHLSEIRVVSGQNLARGEQIGIMGSSGAAAVMVHLHFEVRKGPSRRKAKPVDPHFLWVNGVGQVTCFDPGAQYTRRPIRLTYPTSCR